MSPVVIGLQVSAPDFYTGAENWNPGLHAYVVLLSGEPPHLGFETGPLTVPVAYQICCTGGRAASLSGPPVSAYCALGYIYVHPCSF